MWESSVIVLYCLHFFALGHLKVSVSTWALNIYLMWQLLLGVTDGVHGSSTSMEKGEQRPFETCLLFGEDLFGSLTTHVSEVDLHTHKKSSMPTQRLDLRE